MEEMRKIYSFINQFWKFIKSHEIPAQNDDEAWDVVVADAADLTKDHQSSDPLDKLYRMWVIAYLEYMSSISKGMPTLMQECNSIKKEVMVSD